METMQVMVSLGVGLQHSIRTAPKMLRGSGNKLAYGVLLLVYWVSLLCSLSSQQLVFSASVPVPIGLPGKGMKGKLLRQ